MIIYSKNSDLAQKIAALLEKNSASSIIINDRAELDRLLTANPPLPLFYAEAGTEKAADTAHHSIFVYVEEKYSQENLLSSLRSGAFDYFSLDGRTGSIEDVITRINQFELKDIKSAGLIRYMLEANEQHFRTVAENAFHSEFWLDASDDLVFQSPSIEKMTGFPLQAFYEDSPGFFKRMIYPLDLEGFEEQAVPFKSDIDHPPIVRTYRIVTKTGELRWWETFVEHIFDRNGNYIGKRGTSRDITEQVHAAEETAKIISEKELLVKEVHHRVKNNLAIISGIINLQELYLHG